MPVLTVKLKKGQRHINFVPGRPLRVILDETDLRVRAGCSGVGNCGLCRVKIENAEFYEPTPGEYLLLSKKQLVEGVRLACQIIPKNNLKIKILNAAPKAEWRSLPFRQVKSCSARPLKGLSYDIEHYYAIAVDLGTTHISLSLWDLDKGKIVTGRYGLNPQISYGLDVITRLITAAKSPEHAKKLSRQSIEAIGQALLDISIREGIDLQQIVRVVLVGNTPMLALLSGKNYQLLLDPAYWMDYVDCLPQNSGDCVKKWRIHPRAVIETISPLAGFIGSDLLSGILSTRFIEERCSGLFIDFGTNSEIALWDGKILRVTSAAGGPAFEGCNISCGMPAEPGAIYRIIIKRGVLDFDTIAGEEPLGICGSGLIDLIANLVKSGDLSNKGIFTAGVHKEGFVVSGCKSRIMLTKGDVDLFQRAKAAIGAGISVLLNKAGMEYKDLERIYIAGAFGRFLHVANAQMIGLLPDIPFDRIELCGNAALMGCEDLLLSPTAGERLKKIRKLSEITNLSQSLDFNELFFKHLFLQSFEGE